MVTTEVDVEEVDVVEVELVEVDVVVESTAAACPNDAAGGAVATSRTTPATSVSVAAAAEAASRTGTGALDSVDVSCPARNSVLASSVLKVYVVLAEAATTPIVTTNTIDARIVFTIVIGPLSLMCTPFVGTVQHRPATRLRSNT
ncbi:hypothetical protein JYT35_00275 [Acidimicrobium ferrooxidans]|uniref:Uncharacterized protein n=1 Tax=Acidimicrobium ferrooxidans TaxID=53635 RepID=A0ABS3ATG4_9ACTN|nr:hypothetical protein [Acidimicrobium ferrooxidans]